MNPLVAGHPIVEQLPAGGLVATATLAATEDVDTTLLTGQVISILAALAASESADQAAVTGLIEARGQLAAAEASDLALIEAHVRVPPIGVLVASEQPDIAKFWYVYDILQGLSDSAELEGLASLVPGIEGTYDQPMIAGSGATPRIEGR